MADNALARALALYNSPPQKSVNALPLYGALSDTGGGAPSIANQLARALLNVPTAISEAFKGNSYGSADPNNAIADAARQQFWRGSVFGVPEDVKKRNYERALNVALAAPTVYHGSPHKFDAFDSSKIGTGEGAQAYGHGLYFAENPQTALSYKNDLATQIDAGGATILKNNKRIGTTGNSSVDDLLIAHNGDVDAAINYVKSAMNDGAASRRGYAPELAMLESMRPTVKAQNTGSLYTVDLPDAMAAKMLDWDKPLSQQHPDVQSALNSMVDESSGNPIGPVISKYLEKNPRASTGSGVVNALQSIGYNKEEAARMMRDAGIPGIRYLDQGSRGAGQGTYNYVAFPGTEGALKILERK